MDVGCHHRGVDAQLLAIFQAELNGALDYGRVDRLHGGWGESIEGTVESSMLGPAMTVEVRKGAQGMAVIDAFPQLAILPVLDAHEAE